MKRLPKISETEWEIMKVIWAKAPLSSHEIIEVLMAQDSSWHPKTVRTLINRLVKKKALGIEMEGRAYVYRPLVKESDCVKAASQSFLERVFGGALKPMMAHYVEHQKLSTEEIRELKRLIEEKE